MQNFSTCITISKLKLKVPPMKHILTKSKAIHNKIYNKQVQPTRELTSNQENPKSTTKLKLNPAASSPLILGISNQEWTWFS